MNRRDMPGRCHGCGGILPPTRRAWCHECFVPGTAERRRDVLKRAGKYPRRLSAREEHTLFLGGLVAGFAALPFLAGGSWWALVPLSITAALWRSVILYGEPGR